MSEDLEIDVETTGAEATNVETVAHLLGVSSTVTAIGNIARKVTCVRKFLLTKTFESKAIPAVKSKLYTVPSILLQIDYVFIVTKCYIGLC